MDTTTITTEPSTNTVTVTVSQRGSGLAAIGASRLGLGAIVAGFVAIALGWWGAAGHFDLRKQFPYLVSGGVAGLALVVLGAGLLVVDALKAERAQLGLVLERLEAAGQATAAAADAASIASAGAGLRGDREDGDPAGADDVLVATKRTAHLRSCRLVADRPGVRVVDPAEVGEDGLATCRVCLPDGLTGDLVSRSA